MELPDLEQFTFKECVIAGDECWLIIPNHIGTKWFDHNARFRSCIVRKSDNFVVSQGFGKFTNFGERPEFQPWDNSWKIEARHKLDGSLLLVSKYKGELIIRTRGTTDARQMHNGHEIDVLIEQHKHLFENVFEGSSLLLEWTTPNNVIVLREHDKPTLTLVGEVRHSDASYSSQEWLDVFAKTVGVARPQKYEYNSIEECILDVAAWRGKEGVVLYSPDGQTLKKIKADEYCELHKLATGIKGVKQVLDVFLTSPKFVTEVSFYKYIEDTLDFEIAEKCSEFIVEIINAYNKFLDIYIKMTYDVSTFVKPLESRKEQAMYITSKYKGWKTVFAFNILDGKELEERFIRIAMENILEL